MEDTITKVALKCGEGTVVNQRQRYLRSKAKPQRQTSEGQPE